MTRYLEAQPVLVDVMLAKEAIPAMAEQKRILHSGPPIAWEEMCGPVKGAIIGAMLYEGWATSQQDAENQINAGEIDLAPCHHYHAVGPMAGIISPSMPLWVVENKTNGSIVLLAISMKVWVRFSVLAPITMKFSIVWPGCAMNWRRQ